MAADDSGASPAPADVRRGLRRTIAVAVAVTLVLLALAVWPVPMLWRGPSLSAGARVLLRDPADLRLPTTEAGTVAAGPGPARPSAIFTMARNPTAGSAAASQPMTDGSASTTCAPSDSTTATTSTTAGNHR